MSEPERTGVIRLRNHAERWGVPSVCDPAPSLPGCRLARVSVSLSHPWHCRSCPAAPPAEEVTALAGLGEPLPAKLLPCLGAPPARAVSLHPARSWVNHPEWKKEMMGRQRGRRKATGSGESDT